MTQREMYSAQFLRDILLISIPFLTLIILITFLMLPFNTPVLVRCGGLLPLMGITYWTLVRPRTMNPVLVFIIGCLVDIVTFMPIGLHAFVFLIVQSVLKSQRRFLVGQGFWVLWACFALLAFITILFLTVMTFLITGAVITLTNIITATILTTAFLPVLLWCLEHIRHIMDVFDEPV